LRAGLAVGSGWRVPGNGACRPRPVRGRAGRCCRRGGVGGILWFRGFRQWRLGRLCQTGPCRSRRQQQLRDKQQQNGATHSSRGAKPQSTGDGVPTGVLRIAFQESCPRWRKISLRALKQKPARCLISLPGIKRSLPIIISAHSLNMDVNALWKVTRRCDKAMAVQLAENRCPY